jgi:thioredoxin-like negative regulator of GroEL
MKIVVLFFLLVSMISSCKKKPLVDTSKNNIPDITSFDQLEEPTKEGVSLLFFHNSSDKNSFEIRPTIEAIALDPEFEEVFFAEIEYEEHIEIANYYLVRGFPTIVFLKDGLERNRYTGKSHSREKIENMLRELMVD